MKKVKVITYYEKDEKDLFEMVYRFKNKRLIIRRTDDKDVYHVTFKKLLDKNGTIVTTTGITVTRMGRIIWINELKLTKDAIEAMYDATKKIK